VCEVCLVGCRVMLVDEANSKVEKLELLRNKLIAQGQAIE
jgi:hypothetical protein